MREKPDYPSWLTLSTPMAIEADVGRELYQAFAERRPIHQAAYGSDRGEGRGYVERNNVAIFPVRGILSLEGASWLEEMYFGGGTSLRLLKAGLKDVMRRDDIKGVLLHVSSPGGSVFGVAETADLIRKVRTVKPVFAVADPMAASAALWLACSATEVSVIPSGQIGSHGVISSHEDLSRALDRMGIKVSVITSSKHKAEFSDVLPLSDDARSEMQSKVDGYHKDFTRGLAAGRGKSEAFVEAHFGQGRMMRAADAIRVGMADREEDVEAALARLVSGKSGRSKVNAVEARARAVEVSMRQHGVTMGDDERQRIAARARAVEVSERMKRMGV